MYIANGCKGAKIDKARFFFCECSLKSAKTSGCKGTQKPHQNIRGEGGARRPQTIGCIYLIQKKEKTKKNREKKKKRFQGSLWL